MTLIAFWRGDWRARAISASVAAPGILGLYVCRVWACWGAGRPPIMAWRPMIDDAIALLVCLVCAWRADRYWVLAASAFALLSVITDAMSFIPGVSPWASGSADIVWAYGLNTTVLIGVWPSVRASWRPARGA